MAGWAENDRVTLRAQAIWERPRTHFRIQGPVGALQHHLVQPELQGVHLMVYRRCNVVKIESAMQSDMPAPGRVRV